MFKIDEGIGRPKTLSQLLPSNQLARTDQKRSKNLKRFFLKFQAMPLPPQFSAAQVSFILREANDSGALIHVGRIAPEGRANTKVTKAMAESTDKLWTDICLWECPGLARESRYHGDYPKLRDLDVTSVTFVFAVAVLP